MELLNATKMQAAYTMGTEPSAREHIVVAVKGTFALPERDGDVCDFGVIPVGEKEKIGGTPVAHVAIDCGSPLPLLPCVARELDPVEREHRLDKS